MSPEMPEAEEAQWAAWLAACDEALAAGKDPQGPDIAGLPPEVRARLEQELARLRRARQLFQAPPPATPSDTAARDDAPSRDTTAEPALLPALPQTNLGRFEVRRELGRGGFGVVFLAFDPLLGREVALKVPRAYVLASPEWRERFQREARAASVLDHPNLVPVYEAGAAGPVCYIASAYCPGPTLAAWLKGRTGPVPFRTAALLLTTLADAVEHAHRRGVLHCDLKPGNVLLSPAPGAPDGLGFVPRVTDFGLAKLLGDEAQSGLTQSGAVVGTAEYMAPEQAGGRRKDLGPAADIYALGVILYELLTGRPPFRGETDLDTLLRVQAEEPVPPARRRPQLPRDLQTICLKCLHKEPQRRYAGAGALAEDLRRYLAGEPIAARPARAWERAWRWCRRRPAAAALLLSSAVAALALSYIAYLSTRPILSQSQPGPGPAAAGVTTPPPLRPVPFTTFPGRESGPTFSPDGTRMAFSWDGDQASGSHIYAQSVGAGAETLQLTRGPGEDVRPAWSPDGNQIAFLRKQGGKVSLCTVPAPGGPEQVLLEDLGLLPNLLHPNILYWSVTWSPDGKLLAFPCKESPDGPAKICSFSIADRKKRVLTLPPPGLSGDGGPTFSPDGQWLAFLRAAGGKLAWHLYVAPVNLQAVPVAVGEPKRLTDERLGIRGCTWTPDSSALVFAWSRTFSSSLWRIPVTGGPPRPLALVEVGHNAYDPAIPLRGSRLAYVDGNLDTDIWRVPLAGPNQWPTQWSSPTRLISTTRMETAPSYSPDGKQIAFASNRDGSLEIWVCDSEGKNPKRLTSLRAVMTGTPRWSPDGKQIAFDTQLKGHSAIYLVSANGGLPQPLTTGESEDRVPSWSRDGKWVYFESDRGGTFDLWKMPAEGGAAVQLTHDSGGARSAFEARDGHVYYFRQLPAPCVWKAPVEGGVGGDKVFDLPKGSWWGSWTFTERGLYFINPAVAPPTIEFFDWTTRRTMSAATFGKNPPRGVSALAVSPDGRSLLYVQVESDTEDIMLVEDFR
jgi:Tol biopolymer transport system component/serine/threonine protein kinase